MVNGFAQIGRFDEALVIFRIMGEERVVQSRFTVTGVLSVFAMMGNFDNGRVVHGFALKMGYDLHFEVSNALIDMYGKCKFTGDAWDIFEMIVEKDIYSWNSIIAVHEQCCYYDESLTLFDKMLSSGILPDLVTITIVVPAFSHLAALMHGRQIHGYMIKIGLGKDVNKEDFNDVLMTNAVIDMYTKCGNMRNAYMLFDKMKNKDAASWNIMIVGYGMHGNANKALDMFSRMCEAQIEVDEVTFVETNEVKIWYASDLEQYTCVVDMFGRAGHVEEAFELVQNMPFQANTVVWRALLAAWRFHRNSDIAKVSAQKLMELDP